MKNEHERDGEKALDMARTILASTRGDQRNRRLIHHRERQSVRGILRRIEHDVEGDDDTADDPAAPPVQTRRDLADMVYERRAGDKVGPLIRWAVRCVESDADLASASLEDRMAHFRGILPGGLVGEHALSHLQWVLDPDIRRRPSRGRSWHEEHVEEVRAAAEHVLDCGFHRELNRVLRPERWRGPNEQATRRRPVPVARFLLGRHDLDAFAEAVAHTDAGRRTIRFAAALRERAAR